MADTDSQDGTPEVVIYGTEYCPYCTAARMLLKKKGVNFIDVSVSNDEEKRKQMTERSGGHTVPQIFIDDKPIGGFDDLYTLDLSGELDEMLGLK